MEFSWSLMLEILGFSTGLLYLWWEYHADSKLWFASMVMPCISMWIYFSKGLYADFGINIYYLVIAVYGYLVWTRRRVQADSSGSSTGGLPVTHTPPLMVAVCAGAAIALWAALYFILKLLTDSTVPLADAFTTALSIVAMWMLARKWLEQWLVWLVVDAVCVGLYIYKGIYFYATLYAIYTVIAWCGYRKWRRMMVTQPQSRP